MIVVSGDCLDCHNILVGPLKSDEDVPLDGLGRGDRAT